MTEMSNTAKTVGLFLKFVKIVPGGWRPPGPRNVVSQCFNMFIAVFTISAFAGTYFENVFK